MICGDGMIASLSALKMGLAELITHLFVGRARIRKPNRSREHDTTRESRPIHCILCGNLNTTILVFLVLCPQPPCSMKAETTDDKVTFFCLLLVFSTRTSRGEVGNDFAYQCWLHSLAYGCFYLLSGVASYAIARILMFWLTDATATYNNSGSSGAGIMDWN